jgi:GR25 family glycosyltransferase involved in LPS biosynthesis
MVDRAFILFVTALFAVLVLLVFALRTPAPTELTRVLVINMDKNTGRMDNIKKHYDNSNMSLELERFPAVPGANLNPKDYVTPDALMELAATEQNGFRTKHHQLTRGAIGCYLSHVKILEQIRPADVYFILEDDAVFEPGLESEIKNLLTSAPRDWDIILLGYNTLKPRGYRGSFLSVNSFWGLCGYLINHKGAQKFLRESSKQKIDCQIDSLMSWMSASHKLNVWALRKRIVFTNPQYETDIQVPVKVSGESAFMYRDKILQL